ncbi:MAG: glutamate synthase subunit beta [Fulvivirga sp.]
MTKANGFMTYNRELPKAKDPKERLKEFKEFYEEFSDKKTKEQAARCMDCGIPFCHKGCPLGNNIPEWNDAVYHNDWEYAVEIAASTNNFPEFTGRICPAPCEGACVLGINKPPVTIEFIEKFIAEKGFEFGLYTPFIPQERTGKKVAVIGSGPAGLAAADQLNRAGHEVTVFERDDRIGGLLTYGIPDFKLEKWVVERRVNLLKESGIKLQTNVNVGVDIAVNEIKDEFDAIMLCGGSTVPRDLTIPGRQFKGVHFAMDFLKQNNKRVAGDNIPEEEKILATDKKVVVIGGGDTGSDCVGTSNRQKAISVTQIELLEQPPKERTPDNPWPLWPMILRTSSSHEEGVRRNWALHTKEFIGDEDGNLTGLKVVEIEWKTEGGKRPHFVEKEETERVMCCDLALLAVGFVHPEPGGLLKELNVELDERGNVKCDRYQSSVENVFAAGDMRRGQSLVVWAISEGREAARAMDIYLMGSTNLESKNDSFMSTNRAGA